METAGAQDTAAGAGQHAGSGLNDGAGEGQAGFATTEQLIAGLQQCCFILCRSQPAEAGLPPSKTVKAITSDHWAEH